MFAAVPVWSWFQKMRGKWLPRATPRGRNYDSGRNCMRERLIAHGSTGRHGLCLFKRRATPICQKRVNSIGQTSACISTRHQHNNRRHKPPPPLPVPTTSTKNAVSPSFQQNEAAYRKTHSAPSDPCLTPAATPRRRKHALIARYLTFWIETGPQPSSSSSRITCENRSSWLVCWPAATPAPPHAAAACAVSRDS